MADVIFEVSSTHPVSIEVFDGEPGTRRQLGNGWYFWDETWSDPIGPYPSREEVDRACHEYAAELEAEREDLSSPLGAL
jgi:hypothetical protein